MKKKLLAGLATGLFLVVMVGMAEATSVTFDYTADNVVNAWYLVNGTTTYENTLGSNAGDWWLADSLTLDVQAGATYDVIWQTADKGGVAGFLAAVSSDATLSGSLLSSTDWFVSKATNYIGGATWETATSYGKNDGSASPWAYHNLVNSASSIAGISTDAEWIWTGDRKNDNSIFVKTTFTADPVPEPATMLLFGTGLVGLAGVGIKRKKKA